MIKIALIVGHEINGKDRGAVNYKGETESSFNNRICQMLQQELGNRNIQSKIFYRDDIGIKGVALNVAQYDPDVSIEFHFNSFHRTARGCEALALENDTLSIEFADLITDVIRDNLGIEERNNNGVLLVGKGANGFWNLNYIDQFSKRPFPKIIIEPVFANIKTNESQRIFENEPEYVKSILMAIMSYFSHEHLTYVMKKPIPTAKLKKDFLTIITDNIKSILGI